MSNKNIEIINNSKELWSVISNAAQFGDEFYDLSLLNDIKAYLCVPETSSIDKHLQEVSVEDLLNAIFNSVRPFTEMLNDLLNTFEKAGARYGDNNLQLVVDFDKLNFDFDKFKTTVKFVRDGITNIMKVYLIDKPWDIRFLYYINKTDMYNKPTGNMEVDNWIHEYKSNKLPARFPRQPVLTPEFDKRTNKVWNYLNKRYKAIEKIYQPEKGIRESIECVLNSQLNEDRLYVSEQDCFTENLVLIITNYVEYVKKLPNDIRPAVIQDFCKKFDDFFNITQIYETTEEVEFLKSVLNLPYWKHRYDVYSAWIFTLIVQAFGENNLNFNAEGGVLSFRFSGSKLADSQNTNPSLQILAELRSVLLGKPANPRARTKHIQPDYTIAFGDENDPNNAVAVIECKQYKHSNTNNFANAVLDYARSRPCAKIFLVNYGNVNQSVSDRIIAEKVDETRFETFGRIRPGNVTGFVSSLKQVISKYEIVTVPINITLRWGITPRDLDLHLEVFDNENNMVRRVNYNHEGSFEDFPYSKLDNDCTSGYGPETITIKKLLDYEYRLKVKRYSEEPALAEPVIVKVCYRDKEKEFVQTNAFIEWHVFKIKEGKIIKIDEI